MKRGFTLLEVMIATIILSVGLVVLLTSFMNCQKVMMASQDFETAQYVLSLGETAYPLPSPDLVSGYRAAERFGYSRHAARTRTGTGEVFLPARGG